MQIRIDAMKLYRLMLAGIIAFALFTRISEYLSCRSIWLDEACLALNIIEKSFMELMTKPLAYDQAAPVGFLLFTKLLVMLFGSGEYVLRALPFIAGVGSIYLFYKLLKRTVSKKAVLFALVLFSASLEMLRYTTEFKQYATDVFFVLLIQLCALSLVRGNPIVKNGIPLGIAGACVLWFSHPSVFALAGMGTVLFFYYLMNKQFADVRKICLSACFWALSLISLFFLSLKSTTQNTSLESYWGDSFLPLPPQAINEQFHLIKLFLQIFFFPGMIQQALWAMIVFIVGASLFFKKEKPVFYILILPVFFAAMASALRVYPFEGRLLLFYMPYMYLLIAEGLSFMLGRTSVISRLLGVLLACLIIWYPVNLSMQQMIRRTVYVEDIKSVLDYLKTHAQKDEAMYIYYGAEKAFQYYAPRYGFNNKILIGSSFRHDWDKYREELSHIRGYKKVWVIFTHIHFKNGQSEEEYMIKFLDKTGTRLDAVRAMNASAYFYTFSP